MSDSLQNNLHRRVAIIDPFSSADYLVNTLNQLGFEVIAVINSKCFIWKKEDLGAYFNPNLYTHIINFDPEKMSLETLAENLSSLKVDYIFSGTDDYASVRLTDELNQFLKMPYGNNPDTAEWRTNKYEMQQKLIENKLTDFKQMLIKHGTLTDAQLIELKNWDFPAILKPVNEFGSMGVKIIHEIADIQNYLNTKVDKSQQNKANFVLQELLTGTEYLVDSFSANGETIIITVQCYKKINHNNFPVYRYVEFVSPESEEFKICSDFVKKVLKSIDLKNGFAHTELFLTETGPKLIEVNPRISGAAGFINKMTQECLDLSQPKALADFLIDNQLSQSPLKHKKYGRIAIVNNWKKQYKIQELKVEKFSQLSSYCEHLVLKSVGTLMDEPKTLFDSVVYILLTNENLEQLLKDYETLTELEMNHELF